MHLEHLYNINVFIKFKQNKFFAAIGNWAFKNGGQFLFKILLLHIFNFNFQRGIVFLTFPFIFPNKLIYCSNQDYSMLPYKFIYKRQF